MLGGRQGASSLYPLLIYSVAGEPHSLAAFALYYTQRSPQQTPGARRCLCFLKIAGCVTDKPQQWTAGPGSAGQSHPLPPPCPLFFPPFLEEKQRQQLFTVIYRVFERKDFSLWEVSIRLALHRTGLRRRCAWGCGCQNHLKCLFLRLSSVPDL